MSNNNRNFNNQGLICTACGSSKLIFDYIEKETNELYKVRRHYYDCENCKFNNLSIVELVEYYER